MKNALLESRPASLRPTVWCFPGFIPRMERQLSTPDNVRPCLYSLVSHTPGRVHFSSYTTWIREPCYIKTRSPERAAWLSKACRVGGYHYCSLHSNYRSFITKLHYTLPFCRGCTFPDSSFDHTTQTHTQRTISVRMPCWQHHLFSKCKLCSFEVVEGLHFNQFFFFLSSHALQYATSPCEWSPRLTITRVGSVILMDAVAANNVSHCSSTVKVVMLNYTETHEGVAEDGSSSPVKQRALRLPGSFQPALVPDAARCQREPAIRTAKEGRGQKRRGAGVKGMGTGRARENQWGG